MKIGEIIEVEGVKLIVQEGILGCRDCYLEYANDINCEKEFICREHESILVKIPLELLEKIEQLEKQIEFMMNCDNCSGHSALTCSGCKNYSNWGMKK